MAKVMIEVEVEVNERKARDPKEPSTFEFVGVKIPGGSQVLIPTDKPMPRRFAKDLAEAAARNIRGDGPLPTTESVLEEQAALADETKAARRAGNPSSPMRDEPKHEG